MSHDRKPMVRITFSLRILAAFLALCAIVASVVGRTHRERTARRFVAECGGRIESWTRIRDINRYKNPHDSGHVLMNDANCHDTIGVDARLLAAAGNIPDFVGLVVHDHPGPLDLACLAGRRDVQVLVIDGPTRLHAAHSLARLPRLELISLRYNRNVDDSIIEYVASGRRLRCVDVSDTYITDRGAKRLLEVSTLRELRLGNTRVTPEIFLCIGMAENLEYLDVRQTRTLFPEVRPVAIPAGDAEHNELYRFVAEQLRRAFASSETPAVLARDHDPWCGEFRRTRLADGVPRTVNHGVYPASLKWLDLRGWEFSTAALREVGTLPALEYLNIGGHTLDAATLALLAQSPTLKSLGLADTNVCDQDIMLLLSSGSLQALDLRSTRVSVAAIAQVAKSPQIVQIVLSEEVGGLGVSLAELAMVLETIDETKLILQGFPSLRKRWIRTTGSSQSTLRLVENFDL